VANRDPEVGFSRRVENDSCNPTPSASKKLRFNHPASFKVTVVITIIVIIIIINITKLNSILWDRDVTLKTKTHIYHAIVKSTIT